MTDSITPSFAGLAIPGGAQSPAMAAAGMTLRAEAHGQSAPAKGAPSKDADAHSGIRNRTVIVYIAIALIALIPGLLGRANPPLDPSSWPGVFLRRLVDALQDIHFGGGLRFWLGIAGAAMMGLLLLYPVRKALARRRGLGSVGNWFHLHIVMGLLGPVLILYHCNFSHGALNANVALWTMLVVAVSGIVGHFVYARVSADFYGDKRRAGDHLDELIARIRSLDALPAACQALIDRLERFEGRMLKPRRGVIASLSASVRGTVHRHRFHRELGAVIAACAREQRWSPSDYQQGARQAHGLMKQYMDSVLSAAGRSVLEQLWARWRLFHLPVFLVMAAAAVLHIVAVWGMQGQPDDWTGGGRTADQIAQVLATPGSGDGLASEAAVPAGPGKSRPERAPATGSGVSAGAAPWLAKSPRSISERSAAVRSIDEEILSRLLSAPIEVTQPATGPARPDPAPQRTTATAATRPAAALPAATRSTGPDTPITPTKAPTANKIEPLPSGDIEATNVELRQRTDQQPPMGLGATRRGEAAGVLSLSERLAHLKGQRFDHATTRFALTGKHTKIDCAGCHRKTIENTPRDCVACHRQDDVHNGRRNDCARCHTTNRWTQILRR